MAKGDSNGMKWHSEREVIKGTRGDDTGDYTLVGDPTKNSTIDGRDGNDTIIDEGGENWLIGGNGNDKITGGYGKDLVSGGNNDDIIDPGANYDRVFGDAGTDKLIYNLSDLGKVPSDYPDTGAPFTDSYSGGEGSDTLNILMTQEHMNQGYYDYIIGQINNWDRASDLYLTYNPDNIDPATGNVMQLNISPDIETINIYQGSTIADTEDPANLLYTKSVETNV